MGFRFSYHILPAVACLPLKPCISPAKSGAVRAGCMQLTLPIPGGQSQASTEANSILTTNNFSPANATVTFTQDTVRNHANAPEINCSLTTGVPTYFMQVLGIKTVSLKAHAEVLRSTKAEGNPGNVVSLKSSGEISELDSLLPLESPQ